MKARFLMTAVVSAHLALATSFAVAQTPLPAMAQAPVTPQAGYWEVSTTMKGTPSGDQKSTKKVCLSAAQVSAGFEQAILDSVASGEPGKGALKCTVNGIQRDGTKASWPAACEGPRGPMQGNGFATIEASGADLTQAFEIKTPLGSMKLQQVIQAKRLGDCV